MQTIENSEKFNIFAKLIEMGIILIQDEKFCSEIHQFSF